MTIVATNNITVSNVNDGTITHTAYAYSADGTDRFTTIYPNLNLLDGTRDFSGTWTFSGGWVTDGTYKGLTVKKRTARWNGIYKTFTVPKDGAYTFSAYIKSSGNTANIFRFVFLNGVSVDDKLIGNNFDWFRDSVTLNLKANDTIFIRYEISGAGTDSILWNAGHKWEFGSVVTSYMPSSSEVTNADWPSYIGQYSDFTSTVSTDPAKYAPWTIFKGNDGVGVTSTVITYAMSTSGTTAPSTGWTSSIPTLVKGQYLWTKTVWTYTDNSSETGYSVTYISKDGIDGDDGLPGKDGVGIQTTTITYASSTSGTTAPSTGWTSAVPTVPAGSYLWTKTVWGYTDNTSETGYSVAMMGVKGQPGANAPTITNVQDQIYLSTSNTAQSGGSWGTLIPAWSSGKYYWSRVATTFSNSTTTYSTPVLDEALNQAATNQVKVTQLTQDLDGFKTTVSNTYLSKSDASGTYADKVSVTSQINQSATQVTQNIQSWTNGQLSSYSTIQSTDSSIASAVADKADKSQITQLSDSINLKVSKGDVVSSINQEAGQIIFNANKLVLNANTTEITGDAFIGGDMIVDGSIKAEKLEVANLSALSSNIGSIQNDFTLEDGTTGTLHIGSSEYRIDSQVLLYDYLFKENIFFNPDGLSFSFDGDTASSSGYGNYRKSGSDFYLQNNQRASYTVSGIGLSNEFAGYTIRIDDNHKMGFVSENGQGFEFTGDVSANGRSLSRRAGIVKGIYYSLSWTFRRIGDIVYVDVPRQGATLPVAIEENKTAEPIPIGFRPAYQHSFSLSTNSGSTVGADVVVNMLGDNSGLMRITNTTTTFKIVQGSTSYITNDPFPS